MVSGGGDASRPKTKKKGLMFVVPEMGDTLCAYTAGCKNCSDCFCCCSQKIPNAVFKNL